MNEVTLRVPATSANFGPGFDCLGVALEVHNDITIRVGAGAEMPPMVAEAAQHFFSAARLDHFEFECFVEGEVPQSRGLGSSVTVRLGVLAGLNEITGAGFGVEKLFQLCAELEGHPDNAAPAAFGGFTVAHGDAVARFEVLPELSFALVVPDYEVTTEEARRLLPEAVGHGEAVASASNVARIVAAFASGDYELLRGAFVDYLHQPYRHQLVPNLYEIIQAGEDAGALGGYLSGSGSAICCVTLKNAEDVAEAMLRAAGGGPAYALVAQVDNNGVGIVEKSADLAH